MFMLLLLHRIDSAAWLYYALYRSTEREKRNWLIKQNAGATLLFLFFSEKLYADSRFVAAALFWVLVEMSVTYIKDHYIKKDLKLFPEIFYKTQSALHLISRPKWMGEGKKNSIQWRIACKGSILMAAALLRLIFHIKKKYDGNKNRIQSRSSATCHKSIDFIILAPGSSDRKSHNSFYYIYLPSSSRRRERDRDRECTRSWC